MVFSDKQHLSIGKGRGSPPQNKRSIRKGGVGGGSLHESIKSIGRGFGGLPQNKHAGKKGG